MRRGNLRLVFLCLLVAIFTTAMTEPALAQGEQLEVTFDLGQYNDTGSFSFSLDCIVSPPTGRGNYVLLAVVWLEDSNGNYVTTLHRWGRTYVYNLKRWALASDMAIDGTTESTPTSNGDQARARTRTMSPLR